MEKLETSAEVRERSSGKTCILSNYSYCVIMEHSHNGRVCYVLFNKRVAVFY